jgi:hypothetical protein
MSQITKGIFGTIAISLALGATQLASGHDLGNKSLLGLQALTGTPETIINRAAKTDRVAGVAGSAMPTRTISLRLDSLAETSILVRVPVAGEPETVARNGPAAPAFIKPGERNATLACEPVVSVLTEVAKLLQPGRCVT